MSPFALFCDMTILLVAIGSTSIMLTMNREKDTEGQWFQRATPWYVISGASAFALKFTTLYENFGALSLFIFVLAIPLHLQVKKLRRRIAHYRAEAEMAGGEPPSGRDEGEAQKAGPSAAPQDTESPEADS